ncbi:MAG TPA: glycogen debranching protein [Pseudonocardia sp.]|nr:glycogen debranching protein [Pseudonocardia sp.]
MSSASPHRQTATESTDPEDDLAAHARQVLRQNDGGGWTKAAPFLYPHQWSWDSAFIAMGWAQFDLPRAGAELRHLFSAQWRNGMVPHIVFDPAAEPGSYFPDHTWWAADRSPDAPRSAPFTSGLCQPPVHALAVQRMWQVARRSGGPVVDQTRAYLAEMFPKLLAWHRYLAERRDPQGSGLVTIYHPWESADNSPRWDVVMDRIEVGDLPAYRRRDTAHVSDAAQRPTDAHYDCYLWLVELLKEQRYDDAAVHREHPFLIKDVFFSAVLVAANTALMEIADVVGADHATRRTIARWIDTGRRGAATAVNTATGLAYDIDLRTGLPIPTRTFAGLAPLLVGGGNAVQRVDALEAFDSADFTGHADLRWALLPSTSPHDPRFEPRNYWRGPVWPVVNWLFWRALRADGESDRAERLRQAGLTSLREVGFAEYIEPLTGEPLGSPMQSWTAAVALDWLAAEAA